jgi:hypothetical protein
MGYYLAGKLIPTEQEQLSKSGILKFAFVLENPKEAVVMYKQFDKFPEYYRQLFKSLVVEIHKYLIRITPMHTGKLRGGWTAFLDKYQINYTKQLLDTSLYNIFKRANVTPEYKQYQFNYGEVQKGKASSQLEDKLPMDTDVSIENQVEYKDHLDFGTTRISARHFTEIARYKGELWFTEHFQKWINKMNEAGAIVPPPDVKEIDV